MTHRVVAGILALAAVVCAQRRVDPRNTYFRVICVVPLTGQGTKEDPKRPAYAPTPAAMAAAQAAAEAASAQTAAQASAPSSAPPSAKAPVQPTVRKDILAYTQQISDDGRYAVVEYVAQDRAAFQAIFNDKSITVFEKGKATKDVIEGAIKKYIKDFNLDTFGVVMP